jgi:succinate dehydrogenase/fumarate reductase cytochrome b subunit
MKKTFLFFVLSSLFLGVLFFSLPALAQTTPETPAATTPAAPVAGNPLTNSPQMSAFQQTSGIARTSVAGIAGTIITTVLGLLGIIFVALLVYAGIQWMTAEGSEEKIEKAKNTIVRAIIGLAIVIVAYSITYFVFNAINTANGNTGGDTPALSGSGDTH